MHAMITTYKVEPIYKGDTLEPRPELQEALPRHADMLRYDVAFHDPQDLSRVVFPVFKTSKYGTTMKVITYPRWRSFSLKLTLVAEQYIEGLEHWVGYRHPDGNPHDLVKETLGEYITRNSKDGKMSLAAWHR